ncbi:MAG: cyclic nucleotide-binding domain-containing protein [Bacteroidales bacterium]|nr:cyclic nucleotide-binding domain-containing protein [Bacteroidales bacterium]
MEISSFSGEAAHHADLLSTVSIFSETEPAILEKIAGLLREIRVKKSQQVFGKGDQGDAMFIVKSGRLKVHDGTHVLSRLEAGQVFGEYALFDNETRSASVTAEEPSVLLALPQDDFYALLADKKDVIQGVLRKVIQRIREMNELEAKLAKSYLKIQKQKNEIGEQHQSILEKKKELEKKNKDLQELNREKNQLISFVSHGLRNPLTSSLCVIDLLEEEMKDCSGEMKQYINLIHSSLRRMNSLINQTLDIDTIQLQRSNIRTDRVDLFSLLKELKESFRYTLSLKKLNIHLDLEKVVARGDKNFMYVVFDNLLSNAIKFSPPNKNIYITLTSKDGKAKITIRDEGPGISNHALMTLFDKPETHDRPSDRSGLLITRKYVEAMNGEILCESRPHEGTSFTVFFEI